MTTNRQHLSTETLLQLVADPRRRTVLHHLRESEDGAVALDDLTATVASDGGTATVVRQSADEPRVLAELHHTHLPKLAEAGVVRYDRSGKTVRYRPDNRIEKLLEFVSTRLE